MLVDSSSGEPNINLTSSEVFSMTLEDIINNLETLSNNLTICAENHPNWSRSSQVELVPATQVPVGCKFPYFLEVSVAKNVLRAWSYARGGQIPNLAKKCEAVIYYAENDAYIMIEQEQEQEQE